METENKDWKPEVGGKAWWVCLSTIKQGIVSELDVFRDKPHARLEPNFGWIRTKMLFPTPEAALASIRVYDLEGKEVLIPRAIHFSGICSECGSSIALDAKQTNAMEKLAEAAYNMQFGGGAAIGGKSDQREGGC